MHTVEQVMIVARPVHMVYNQWTQFEKFPEFMHGIEEAQQVDDTHLHWKARIAGKTTEWDAEITEQEPDRRISWKSVSGARNAGTVRFRPLGINRTEVILVMAYETQGAAESMAHALGRVRARVKQALLDFKEYAESHASETGAWRGEVVDGEPHAQPYVHRVNGWPLLH